MGKTRTGLRASVAGGGRGEHRVEHDAPFVRRMLAELDAAPAATALRSRAAAAGTETEFRSLRGAWVAAVLRALRRAAAPRRSTGTAARGTNAAGARRW